MKSENFVVITFPDQARAIDAAHKMQDLAFRGDIAMGYSVILKKGDNGQIEVLKKVTEDGKDSWSGMFIGMLAGMFFGPFGFLLSMLTGSAIGAGMDYSKTKSNDEFVNRIKDRIAEGRVAIIANCDEQSDAFIDEAMKDFDGEVFRTVLTK